MCESPLNCFKFLRQQLSDKIKILGPTPKPIARTHNLYHYQIIVKYRFEDHLESVLNQILDMTQLPENKYLRLVIDHEPQKFYVGSHYAIIKKNLSTKIL